MGICFRTICIFCCRMMKIWRHLLRLCLSGNACVLLTCLKAAALWLGGGKHKTNQMWCLQSSGTDKQREMKTEWGSSLSSGSEQSQTGEIVYVQWRYWGILTFLSGLHKTDKSFPSLNMLSILHKAPRHPLSSHRHPQCIRTILCKSCSIRKITTMEALYLRASILLLFFIQLIPFAPCSSDPL